MQFSLTIAGLLAMALATAAKEVGIDIGEGQISEAILTIIQLAGVASAWYGRVRKGDISLFGVRK